jgi:hypothetical protein
LIEEKHTCFPKFRLQRKALFLKKEKSQGKIQQFVVPDSKSAPVLRAWLLEK